MTFHSPGRFSCDTCPEVLDTEMQDSRDAFRAIRRTGWRSYKGPDHEWANSCPECVAEWAARKRRQ